MAAENRSDQERIQALVTQGKITQEEADRLTAALQDTGSGNTDSNNVDSRINSDDVEPTKAGRENADRVAAGAADLQQKLFRQEAVREALNSARAVTRTPLTGLPEGLRWVRASMLTGDLDVCVDPSLSEPAVDSEAGEPAHFGVEREGDNFVIRPLKREKDKRPRREGLDGLVDGVSEFVGGFFERMGDLSIRIPAGFGVVVDSKAGDVSVSGVPFVKARLLAGDLNVRDVDGVDLGLSAGDVNASLRLTKGEHRVKLSAGDLNVTLLEGSSVRVTGGVSMGDADADIPLTTRRTGMGSSLSGQVGGGEARLEVSVSAGDLVVRCG